jgi:hypothetical protein
MNRFEYALRAMERVTHALNIDTNHTFQYNNTISMTRTTSIYSYTGISYQFIAV